MGRRRKSPNRGELAILEIRQELEAKFPHVVFANSNGQYRASCKSCWEIDETWFNIRLETVRKLPNFKAVNQAVKESGRLGKGVPNRRKILTRAQVDYDLMMGHFDFKRMVRRARSISVDLSDCVDWATRHRCRTEASQENMIIMAEKMFEIGTSPDEISKPRLKNWVTTPEDEDDLLDLVPEDLPTSPAGR